MPIQGPTPKGLLLTIKRHGSLISHPRTQSHYQNPILILPKNTVLFSSSFLSYLVGLQWFELINILYLICLLSLTQKKTPLTISSAKGFINVCLFIERANCKEDFVHLIKWTTVAKNLWYYVYVHLEHATRVFIIFAIRNNYPSRNRYT